MIDIQVELWPIERPIPRATNPRIHTDEQVVQIAASIQQFGWTNPILVGADGIVIAGHARLLAARQLGLREVPVIVLAHLSEAQRRALLIADNQLGLNAGWDEEMLRLELAALQEAKFDLDRPIYIPAATSFGGGRHHGPEDSGRSRRFAIHAAESCGYRIGASGEGD
jgi:ParB-like chromosome segregation protein Spo0J